MKDGEDLWFLVSLVVATIAVLFMIHALMTMPGLP